MTGPIDARIRSRRLSASCATMPVSSSIPGSWMRRLRFRRRAGPKCWPVRSSVLKTQTNPADGLRCPTDVANRELVLLGIAPDRPEVEYGWIEPAELILGQWSWPIYHVRRFWEKPSRPVAERLEAAGCLWNCFVVVAPPSTL